MNPWLYGVSRIKILLGNNRNASVMFGNVWRAKSKIASFCPDIIMFYGRPGDGLMQKFGAFIDEVAKMTDLNGTVVVSNNFAIPGWSQREIGRFEEFILYRIQNKSNLS